jgi:hypothetical protein
MPMPSPWARLSICWALRFGSTLANYFAMIEIGTLLVTELANCALRMLCFRYFDILFCFVVLPLAVLLVVVLFLSIGDMLVLTLGP